jgi:hypothetical protein
MINKCNVERVNLKLARSSYVYVRETTFTACSLECKDVSAVRIIDSNFLEANDQPSLLVYDQSTVAVNGCQFKKSRAGAAAVVYKTGRLAISQTKFVDLAGVGVLAFGDVDLQVTQCGFGNISGCAVFAHTGPSVAISESLADGIGGVGVVFRKLAKASLTKSKLTRCGLSGLEVSEFKDVTIDHSIFEQNGQCGLVAVNSELSIVSSDFLSNKFAGLDVKNSKATVQTSVALDNAGGGFAIRGHSEAVFNGGGAGTNQQFGLHALDGATVSLKEFKLLENELYAAYASSGAKLTIEATVVQKHTSVAVCAEGSETELKVSGSEFAENGIAIQTAGGASLSVDQGTFEQNGIHLEANEKSEVKVRDVVFKQSRNGLGVFVTSSSSGTFERCQFLEEVKSGIASDANLKIIESVVKECGVCGIFLYGQAVAEITGSTISGNGPCGVQIMGGRAKLDGNTIEQHATFGVHVHQPDGASLDDSQTNTFERNGMSTINYED